MVIDGLMFSTLTQTILRENHDSGIKEEISPSLLDLSWWDPHTVQFSLLTNYMVQNVSNQNKIIVQMALQQ